MRRSKRKQLSGGAKMKKNGKHPILLGVKEDEFEFLKAAASQEGRAVANFVVYYAMQAAKNKMTGMPKKLQLT